MPDIEVTLKWDASQDGGDTAVSVYQVIHVDNTTAARTANGANGVSVPRQGDQHPNNPHVFAGKPNARRVGFNYYEVTVPYGIERFANADDADPLAEPVEWFWRSAVESRQIDQDIHGNPILNSARAPFDANVQDDHTVKVLVARRNEPFYNVAQSIQFENTVSQTGLSIPLAGIVPAKSVLCRTIQPVNPYTADSTYVRVEYEFDVRNRDLSRARILDQGFSALQAESGQPEAIPGITEPVLLDGFGRILPGTSDDLIEGDELNSFVSPPFGVEILAAPTGEAVTPAADGVNVPADTRAVFLGYQVKSLKDFSELGLFVTQGSGSGG